MVINAHAAPFAGVQETMGCLAVLNALAETRMLHASERGLSNPSDLSSPYIFPLQLQ